MGLQIMIARITARIVQGSAQQLDSSIAEALNSIVENIPMSAEAPSAVQMFIMDIVRQQFQQKPIQVTEISRGSDGKFGKEQENAEN
jgi:hypothetical protein